MSELSREEILAAVHPIDDATVAEIIATGIDHAELVKACHFYAKDRASKTPDDLPRGRIGRVVQETLEQALADEVTALLGRPKYARRGEAPLRRAGATCAQCQQDWGPPASVGRAATGGR